MKKENKDQDSGDILTDLAEKEIGRRDFLVGTAKATAVLAISGTIPSLLISCSCRPEDTPYDILIRGGTLYDGTFAESRIADVGIRESKIVDVGELHGEAIKTIEAKGLIVTPGFIDVHTHCDLTFKRSGLKRHLAHVLPSFKGNRNYMYQGVTTVVTGNCGYGYTNVEYWLDMVNSVGFGTNVYHLAPHGIMREELFGDKQPRELTRKQLDLFKGKVAEAMEMGALGMSTGLEYPPGCLATTEELIELAKVARKYGGLYTTHTRDETGRIYKNGKIGVLTAIKEAIEIGRRAEIPVEISHLKVAAPINDLSARQLLDLIEGARIEGLDVTTDQYPYAAGSTYITILIPNKFVTPDGGVKEEYKTRAGRKEVEKAIEEVFSYLGPEKVLISMCKNEKYEGKSLKEISEIEGRKPSECYIEMICGEDPPTGVFFSQSMDIVRGIIPNNYVMTISDGWTVPKGMTKPHPRVYGTFPRKIRKFVLEEKITDLTSVIRSMTSLPAEKFNLKGRGRIEKGYYADVAVIDLNKITDHATYLDPHRYSEGIQYLTVNGVLSIDEGKATGKRGGKPLLRS